jgi:hypothetical protein
MNASQQPRKYWRLILHHVRSFLLDIAQDDDEALTRLLAQLVRIFIQQGSLDLAPIHDFATNAWTHGGSRARRRGRA